MGFLSGITKGLFGGSDDSSQQSQAKANAQTQAYIEAQAKLARGDAGQLYDQGDAARNSGINLAMALMGQSMPEQMRMYQQGNMEAQRLYSAGQPAYQDAILGMGAPQQAQAPFQMQLPPASSYQTQLPSFGRPVSELLGGVK